MDGLAGGKMQVDWDATRTTVGFGLHQNCSWFWAGSTAAAGLGAEMELIPELHLDWAGTNLQLDWSDNRNLNTHSGQLKGTPY